MSIQVRKSDITTLAVDAIVNAANAAMSGGGGVDGAIHRAAGPELRDACAVIPYLRPYVRCPTGEARITPGFRLPARHIIHTVGPVWRGGREGEPALLANCYRACLELASDYGMRSIAFPSISCGVFGYPPEQAVRIAVATVRACARPDIDVIFCAFDDAMAARYQAALAA